MNGDGQKDLPVHIRWMIRRDMPEVLQIEGESFEFPWSEEDFLRCLQQRNCIGMVAEHEENVVGFMIYELHKSRLHLLNFAVSGRVLSAPHWHPDDGETDWEALDAAAKSHWP